MRLLFDTVLNLDGLLMSQISWEISKIERGDHLQRPTHTRVDQAIFIQIEVLDHHFM